MSVSSLGPLLNGGALTGIAIQLLSARRRLSLRTGGDLPTVGELAVGLRMYVSHCDTLRARRTNTPERRALTHTRAELSELRDFLYLTEVTYRSRDELLARADRGNFSILSARHESERWLPAYFLAWFAGTGQLLLSVRGSQETSDLLTNLSCETEPFLDGVGHRGVVQSARRLHAALLPVLRAHIQGHNVQRLVLIGHSLGAAVASAMTLMLRDGGDNAVDDESDAVLRATTCVAFGAPPFLSRRLAARTGRGAGVTTVVCGLDSVPRLSAASLDRFLLQVARHDWTDQIGTTLERAASSVIGPENAAGVSSFLAQQGSTGAAWAVSAFSAAAQGALERSRAATSAVRSPVWEGALSVGVMASSLLSSQFLQGRNGGAERRPDYAFARHFGMSGDDVERVLEQDGPPEMFLAGEIIYCDIPFLSAEAFAAGERIPAATLVRAGRDEFGDVEGSAWMINHHKPSVLLDQLDRMLEMME